MSVCLRGSKFHYRFQFNGTSYSGPCPMDKLPPNADTRTIEAYRRKALEAEKAVKDKISKEKEALEEQERQIRQNKSVVALVENYKFELTGGKRIALSEAFPLAAAKPARRQAKPQWMSQRESYWNDFTSYMTEYYPDIRDLSAVRRLHAEAYIAYLVRNGRFNKDVSYSITTGKRRKKVKDIVYTRNYLVSPKTVHEIAGACRWVFSKLSEDAGVVGDPWQGVVLPEKDPVDREIFTHDELQLIWEGIQKNAFCYPLFLVAANSGMTEGDICTLEWSEVDWTANCIRRDRRKTGADITLPLLPQLAEYLSSLPRVSEYIFPEHAAMYLDIKKRSGVSSRVISFLQALGIKTTKSIPGRRDVSVKDLHSMRHVFCYRASRAGIPTSSIAKMVGHMDERMTQHYSDHETVEDLNREIAKLSSPFTSDSGVSEARRQLIEMVYRLPEEDVKRLASLVERLSEEKLPTLTGVVRRISNAPSVALTGDIDEHVFRPGFTRED